jgi:hypothetical protein
MTTNHGAAPRRVVFRQEYALLADEAEAGTASPDRIHTLMRRVATMPFPLPGISTTSNEESWLERSEFQSGETPASCRRL